MRVEKMRLTHVVSLIITVFFFGCNKDPETFLNPALSDYYPLQTGKAFIYRMDSTVPASFGTSLIIRSYQAKDTIESTFSDNQGRLSYRIFRFTRDTAGKQPWKFAATYVATPTPAAIEYVDNNMRFLKLAFPVKDGFVFKAHSFIDTKSINSPVPYLDEWEYEYQNTGEPAVVLNKTYNETLYVAQHDETTPPGPFNPGNYQQRNYGVEIYAKDIGLIYKEFLHWTYQTTPPPSKFEDGSYGIKLTLISHY